MKTLTYACVFLSIASPAFAGDWLPLPQSLKDLIPAVHSSELPPAPTTTIDIPNKRVAPATGERDESIMHIAPGKSQTISLERDAASVVVGNPAHASVFLDNSRLLVVVPRAPGATSFTALDKTGKVILNRQIVVTEKDDAAYVRVTRVCNAGGQNGGNNDCAPTTTYFCPDNCVPIAVPQADPNAQLPTVPPIASGAGSNDSTVN